MNHWDRLDAALRAEPLDRLPAALWRNWPEVDRDPALLARAVMGWQRRFDFDLTVYPAPHTCVAEHFGARTVYRGDGFGRSEVERPPVVRPGHWLELAGAPEASTRLSGLNDGLRRMAQALGGTVPLVQSVPSPMTTAWLLAGDALFDHLRTDPQSVEAGLLAIVDATAAYVRDATAAGACGVRLLVGVPESAAMGSDDHRRFHRRWDLEVLRFAAAGARWNMLELDAPAAWIDTCIDYPVQIVACGGYGRGAPGASALARFQGLVAGGIDVAGPLLSGSRSRCYDEAVSAIARLGTSKTLISAGGTCRVDTPDGNIEALIEALRDPARLTTSSGRGQE